MNPSGPDLRSGAALQRNPSRHVRKLDEQTIKLEDCRTRLRQVREENAAVAQKHDDVLSPLQVAKCDYEAKLVTLNRDLAQQVASLHKYAEQENPEAKDTSYVMRTQAQLCKAMHSMGILDHQNQLLRDSSADVIRALKEARAKASDEKIQLELQLMNQLVHADNERKDVESSLKLGHFFSLKFCNTPRR